MTQGSPDRGIEIGTERVREVDEGLQSVREIKSTYVKILQYPVNG